MHRSYLFVPADSDKKIAKAREFAADAVIYDLEDAVLPQARPEARLRLAEHLSGNRHNRQSSQFVRINPIASEDAPKDLAAVMAGAPDGIALPKAHAPNDIADLGARLDALEKEHGLRPGATRILPVATETPRALFSLGDYATVAERLVGITWGAEDLAAAVGAMSKKGDDGEEWSDPFKLARSLCLFAAAAAETAAVDTLYADFRDHDGLKLSAARARRDGFTGKLAIHPGQVDIINNAFTPSTEEIAEAQAIIDLFAENPNAGALSLNGRMIDMPHLVQARKIMALARRR
jgi:citrate lyase subunit beta/citryl-CoA lyase